MSAPLRLLARGGQIRRSVGGLCRSSSHLPTLRALSLRAVRLAPHRADFSTQTRANAEASSATVVPKDRKVGSSQIGGSSNAKGIIDVNPPRGTRDFLPEDKRLQNWLFSEFDAVSRLFGFEQIDFPVLESEELFVRKAGEEITEQLYNFEDKGGRRVTLRPELTPSLARLALQKGKGLPLPAKWFAIGQCWRYERATRGRRREHYQWNMDIIGVPGVEAEAELLAAVTTFFSNVGLSSNEVGIKVSSRKVLQQVLASCGVDAANFGPVCVIVDKMEKLPREKIIEGLGEVGLAPDAVDRILSALNISDVAELEALLGADNEAVADLKQLFKLAEAYGYAEWLVFDASVVRGLAYYTGIVFEGFDRAGQLRAICGGGRYDKLLGTFGGEDQPCAGFGFGDAVIVELLKDNCLLPTLSHTVDDLILVMDEALRPAACAAATKLRGAGRKVDLVLDGGKKMKWAFKQAERCGAKRLVLFAPDEWEKGQVRVKNLETREEHNSIQLAAAVSFNSPQASRSFATLPTFSAPTRRFTSVITNASYKNCSVDSAFKLAHEDGSHQYLDVRSEEEFAAGHPKGATNIPFMFKTDAGMTPNPDFVSQVKAKFPDTSVALLVGCQSGKRSDLAAKELCAIGYTALVNVEGGYAAWCGSGLATET